MDTFGVKTIAAAAITAILASSTLFACGREFEEAPPTLDVELDGLPQKPLGQIFLETTPVSASKPTPDVPARIKEISGRAKLEGARLIEEVDKILADVRAAGGDHESLALLHDLRDALGAAPNECADYIQWRLDHTPDIHPDIDFDSYEYYTKPKPTPQKELTAEIEKRAEEAKGPIRAHWLYLRGAVSFNYRQKEEAGKWFDKVVQEFPNQPRAEIALFMSGRCLLSQSRIDVDYYDQSPVEINRIEALKKTKAAEAIARFHQYLEKYPQGRFVADTYGWLGALESGVVSLNDYIRQVETPGHPEVLSSGIEMIQSQLEALGADGADAATDDEAIALVAKHPRVAMGLLYTVISANRYEDSGDYHTGEPSSAKVILNTKKWRNNILPKLASAVASQKELYTPQDVWQPRYLAILAHAASNAGHNDEALALTESDPESLNKNDDLLFVRAVALSRAGKASEAVETYHNFLARFSSSPLAPEVRVLYGIALRDNHQSGRAVVELQKYLDKQVGNMDRQREKGYEAVEGAFYVPEDEIRQVIDTILNFAPLPELAAVLEDKAVDPGFSSKLKAIVIARALSHEDFDTARKLMTPAEFGLSAANLEKLANNVKTVENAAKKADLESRLGDAWAALHGKLLPLQGLPADFKDEAELAEIKRRINGKAMGYKDVEAELDERDELHHASRWWLRAARRLPSSSLSAACRLNALEAIAQVAGASYYALQRAVEEKMGEASREIYDKLQTESPHSSEAKHAAYWTFINPNQDSDLYTRTFDTDYQNEQRRNSGYYWDDFGMAGESTSDEYSDNDRSEAWGEIGEAVIALRNTSASIPELRKKIEGLRRDAAAHFNSVSQDACINFLDDLALFLNKSDLTGEMTHRYIDLRLDVLNASSWQPAPVVPGLAGIERGSEDNGNSSINTLIRSRISEALADKTMKPVADYLEFLDAAMIANSIISVRSTNKASDKGDDNTYESRDYPLLERELRSFLAKYPHSHKREAARLLLARAVYRQSWPRIETIYEKSGLGSIHEDKWENLKPKRVIAELDAYDREFPKGRYAPEINDMRASVCWRSADWVPALNLTLQQLDNRLPDLRRDAILRLANIFAELNVAEHRPALLDAIRNDPSAIPWLKVYLEKAQDNWDHPLKFLTGFLQDQLGFTIPNKQEAKPATENQQETSLKCKNLNL